ncbi:hypothetical protein Csa_021155, partial [Cucumis sativus]
MGVSSKGKPHRQEGEGGGVFLSDEVAKGDWEEEILFRAEMGWREGHVHGRRMRWMICLKGAMIGTFL